MPGQKRVFALDVPGIYVFCAGVRAVIACDKREAFAQGSVSDEAIQSIRYAVRWIASLALAITIERFSTMG
jgi:hypothetical protein